MRSQQKSNAWDIVRSTIGNKKSNPAIMAVMSTPLRLQERGNKGATPFVLRFKL